VAGTRARKQGLEAAFETWRQSWEAIDNDAYLSYYSDDFGSFDRSKEQWDTYKRRVNDAKSSIQVDVSNLSLFADPGTPEIVSVRFFQRYRSNNYDWDGWKEQLWRRSDAGRWEIIYEGNG
jgi:murein L,D-transpeptidase YafK